MKRIMTDENTGGSISRAIRTKMITKPCGPVFNVHSIMSDFPPTSLGSRTHDLRHANGTDYTDLDT